MINFSEEYDRKNFLLFLKQFLPGDLLENNEELQIDEGNEYFKRATLLGSIKSLENLVVIEVERKRSEKSRITITKELFKFLDTYGYSKALVVTFSEKESHYRFSLIKSDLNWISETKVKKEFSNPKRLSFLLGKNQKIHTANSQLVKLGKVKSLDDLHSRFQIEIVNKEFFDNYKNLFENLSKNLQTDKVFIKFLKKMSIDVDLFAKKLLGQLIFCYFLQKKGWLLDGQNIKFGNGENNFLRKKFLEYENKNKNFYNKFLEYFFYEGLNQKNENNYLEIINCKIPYIGGGLFEYYDGYDWKKENLNIPNHLFSNKKNNGIFDIFDLYNFTVDENETMDIEIAVDPEMLGRVFENLLPENIKKSDGTFYTPRSVVNYICDESIYNYLLIKLKKDVDENELNEFIKNVNFNVLKNLSIKKNASKINTLLSKIKICDPAIGSGAFVVLIMNKIVSLRILLSDYVENKYKKNRYYFKREFIQNSIHGVDIEPSAVEITKLRLWLSLIVEDGGYEKIEPLPNLDFKIIQGNSLIEQFKGINFGSKFFNIENQNLENFFIQSEIEQNIKDLAKLQNIFFTCISYKKKIVYKIEIKKLMKIILIKIIKNQSNQKSEFIINDSDIDNIISSKSKKNFFPWAIFFADVFFNNKGFDLILANPPYTNIKEVNKFAWKNTLNENFGFLDDLYNHFTFLASIIVNKDGIVSFITSDTFMTLQTKKNMRDLLLSNKLITFLTLPKAFKAMVDTCIFVFSKSDILLNDKSKFIDLRNFKPTELSEGDLNSSSWETILNKTLNYKKYETLFFNSKNYLKSFNSSIFSPNNKNNQIFDKIVLKISNDFINYWDVIKTSSSILKNKKVIDFYNNKLKEGSIAMMGLVTIGGQGLATGDNGSFVGVIHNSKEALRTKKNRSKKFYDLINTNNSFKKKFNEFSNLDNFDSFDNFFSKLSEEKIRNHFVLAKKLFGRAVFGQGFIYRIINDDEIFNLKKITPSEKSNGIKDKKKYYVKYDKGDKDGNRWFYETPYYIKWDYETVNWFDQNSGKKGLGMPVIRNKNFYFTKGFCWSNILNPNSKYIKCRMNNECVYDVASMSLTSINPKISNEYLICLLNSEFSFNFLRTFLNSSVNIQINDIRKIPVIIPNKKISDTCKTLYSEARSIKENFYDKKIDTEEYETLLNLLEEKNNLLFEKLYKDKLNLSSE